MEFGTAGLRAAMGAGVACMNDLTIIQTTQVGSELKYSRTTTNVTRHQVKSLTHQFTHIFVFTCTCFLSKGFCRYLEESFTDLQARGVVIGYDARAHPASGGGSKRFASLAAAVFISRGVPVHLFSDITPTPFVVIA